MPNNMPMPNTRRTRYWIPSSACSSCSKVVFPRGALDRYLASSTLPPAVSFHGWHGAPRHARTLHHTGVCEKTLLLRELLPCNPEAEAALQPLIWHSEGLSFQGKYFLEKWFLFVDTGISTAPSAAEANPNALEGGAAGAKSYNSRSGGIFGPHCCSVPLYNIIEYITHGILLVVLL